MAPLLVLLPDSQFLCWSHSAMGAIVHVGKDGESVPSWCKVHHVVRVPCRAHGVLPGCSTQYRPCWTASMNSRFLSCTCMCLYFCVIFSGLKSWSHSDNGHVHATAPCSVCVIAQARPTMSSLVPRPLPPGRGYTISWLPLIYYMTN